MGNIDVVRATLACLGQGTPRALINCALRAFLVEIILSMDPLTALEKLKGVQATLKSCAKGQLQSSALSSARSTHSLKYKLDHSEGKA